MALKSKLGRILVRTTKILAATYFGLLLLVFLAQRSFLYHPARATPESLLKMAESQGFQAWQNSAGQFLGWKQINKAKGEHGRVLIVHGNAGSAIDRLDFANGLQSVEPVDVYILEYPGYGARLGSPSQQSLFQAADEAMNSLKKDGPVYLMGESLGTGVAAYMAGTYPELIRGVLLIAPYNNMTDVAQYHMPIFPVKWMLWDRFASETYLKNYHGPIAIVVGGQDVVVPMKFGRKLYDGYQGPKQIWESPQAGHEDLLERPESWWRDLVVFWKQNSPRSPQWIKSAIPFDLQHLIIHRARISNCPRLLFNNLLTRALLCFGSLDVEVNYALEHQLLCQQSHGERLFD